MSPYIIIAFCLNALANIVLKISSTSLGSSPLIPKITSVSMIFTFFKERYLFLIGIVLFASNVVFYYLALKTTPLSTAYPIMVTMSIILINLYAYFILGESIGIYQIFGYVLLCVGIALIFFGSKI